MTLDDALAELMAGAEPGRAGAMAAYHKQSRRVLGIPNPFLNDLAKGWRQRLAVQERVALADALWQSDIFEARLAAAKLLTQARIPDDTAVWGLIASWVPEFDSWAIADHACNAGARRLAADPRRIDTVEPWIRSAHMWTRRAALVITLPWTKQNHPGAGDLAIRDRVLGWAATLADDRNRFIQKAIGWWLRDLSRHDPDRTRAFLARHGARLKPFAAREAARHLD
ncbi:MAG: DNA alkylation repair protein [Rhodobacteraceae bacterium]|nr:DNA alkylation repair protein [Paracoccaceae bacterium]